MRPKSAILMACVGLACGAVGLGLGASWRAAEQAQPGPRAPRSEDGVRAAQLLLELDDPRSTADMFHAASALLRIDPAAAAEEAAKVLDGPRARTLSKVGRGYMEQWAGR